MEIVYKKINELKPYENNSRTHDESQIKQICESIKEYGWTNPVLIDEKGMIIAGHGRVEAGKKLDIKEVPCIVLSGLTEAQKKAYVIADNKMALNAGWNEELLKTELENLKELDFDLELTGFNIDELDELFKQDEEEQEIVEDDFDIEPPEQPKAKLGDIYQLGSHRLMCGDSTKLEDVEKLMNGVKADMVFTDPPYGMNAVSKSGVLSEKYKTDIMNDDDNTVAIDSFNLCNNYFKETKQVWWGANYYTECLPSAECWIVWDKNNGGSDQTDCELAWTNFRSVVRQFTMASEKINRVHPTQKPLNLISQIFKKFDKNNEYNNIVDLFGGSGSTLIACEKLNRNCYMMELDPHYISVIIERYINFTGNDVYRINPDGTKTNWRDIECENEK